MKKKLKNNKWKCAKNNCGHAKKNFSENANKLLGTKKMYEKMNI
jgi:hypothetical protein